MTSETKPTVTLYAEFYRPLVERLRRAGFQSPGRGALQGRWRSFRAEYPGLVYAVGLNGNPRVFLYLNGPDHKQRYAALQQHRVAINARLPDTDWGQSHKASWIMLESATAAALGDPEDQLEDARQWMADNLIRLRFVLLSYLGLPWQ